MSNYDLNEVPTGEEIERSAGATAGAAGGLICPRCNAPNEPNVFHCGSCFSPLQSGVAVSYAPYAPVPAMNVTGISPQQQQALVYAPTMVPISDLPPGWERRFDVWGREYFVDHTNHRTQWEHPFTTMNAVVHGPASDPAANSMPRFIRQLSEPAYNPNADPVSAPSAAGKDDQRGDGGGDGGELAGANEHKQHVVMDAGEPSCLAIIGDTLARNRCLTCVTVCLWPMLALAIVKGIELHACNTRHRVCTDVSGLPFFILTGIFGYIYLLSFVCCAGVCCLSQCCMGGPCIGDYIHDFMYEEVQIPDQILPGLLDVYQSRPELVCHVECSHMKSSGSGKNRRTKRVVTYKSSIDMGILHFNDVSVHPNDMVDAIKFCSAQYSSLHYDYDFRLSPEEKKWLEDFEARYKDMNKHRDTSCTVWHKYKVASPNTKNISAIVKDADNLSCRYYVAQLCVNRCCLWLAMYSTLYLPYICMWKCLVRPFRYYSIKYLALDHNTQPR